MPTGGLKELYIDELKDLYSAENQLLEALPKMAKAASSPQLQDGFKGHLEQTRGHVDRLKKIFKSLATSPKGKKCMGMEGLVEEGSGETLEEEKETDPKLTHLAKDINRQANLVAEQNGHSTKANRKTSRRGA